MKTRGGKRQNSGRKSKIEELSLLDTMDAILAPKELWTAIGGKIKEGDMQAAKIWASYRFGMPKQSLDIKAPEGINLIFTSAKGCLPLNEFETNEPEGN